MGCAPTKSQILSSEEYVCSARSSEPRNTSFHGDFVIAKKLGKGAFGSVYSARVAGEGAGADLAVKVADLRRKDEPHAVDAKRQKSVEKEVNIMKALPQTDYVIEFHSYYIEGNFAYIVMEMCTMSLLVALERMPTVSEGTLRPVFKQMLLGLQACHDACIVHRDVKPDNFLAVPSASSPTGFTLKLCDFGLANKVPYPDALHLTGIYGTPPYMAPEMLDCRPYGNKVDVWAFGVVMYIMLFGRWPYLPREQTGPAMKAAIRAGIPGPTFTSSVNINVSAESVKLMKALMRREPDNRPSVKWTLEHEFFTTEEPPCADEPSLRPAIMAAKRMGAFEVSVSNKKPTELDILVMSMNNKHHPPEGTTMTRSEKKLPTLLSDASTELGSDAAPSPMVTQ